MECPSCDSKFDRIAQHWAFNEDHRPQLSFENKQRLRGLFMGDGSVEKGSGNSNRKNAALLVHNTNRNFLEEVKNKVGLPATITQTRTAKESYESFGFNHDVSEEGFNPLYRLSFVSHPFFNELFGWYSNNGKVFPSELNLSPALLGAWYACDGSYEDRKNRQPRLRIAATNEMGRDTLQRLFQKNNYELKWNAHSIYFSVEDSQKLWCWMERYKSFEYKYPDR